MKPSTSSDYGIVYLLTNEAMPGLVKIGKTSRLDLEKRMKELYTTGVPLPFECVYACKVKLSCMGDLESALHTAFAPCRVNDSREFFRMSPYQAIPILKLMTSMNEGEVTDEVAAEIENDMDDADKAAIAKSRSRRPPLDFVEMGLQIGSILSFIPELLYVSRLSRPRRCCIMAKLVLLPPLHKNCSAQSMPFNRLHIGLPMECVYAIYMIRHSPSPMSEVLFCVFEY
ncbi:MAG: GIY-YIG nuclease family protein [Lepagella sp.]